MKLYVPPNLLNNFLPKHPAYSSWVDHIAFGYDIIAALEPDIFVDLDYNTGLPFFTFCQSISENRLDTTAYAINPHQDSNISPEENQAEFRKIQKYLRENYRGFTYQIEMSVKEALVNFSQDSIGLLNINLTNQNTFIEHCEEWLSKVKPGGLILVHGISNPENQAFWKQQSQQIQHFVFRHGDGLGILQKADPQKNCDKPLLQLLFGSELDAQQKFQELYIELSTFIQLKHWDRKIRLRTPA